jgi:hypothetical protein
MRVYQKIIYGNLSTSFTGIEESHIKKCYNFVLEIKK